MKTLALLLFLCMVTCSVSAQVNPKNITIIRDTFGVPHIYGNTDAEAVYGLAYAHCEDAFKLIQYNLLPAKNSLGKVLGKNGVLLDFAFQFFGVDTLVENNYETKLSPAFKKIAEAYIQAVNDYAAAHPEEVLVKGTFPFSAKDVIKGYTGIGILLAGAGLDLKAVKDNVMEEMFQPNEKGSGSNAMAIAPSRTEDAKTWLLVNSHQPIEGPMAWYEAHINSKEGLNCLGGLFPGGLSILVGCNEHLGWAHTTDYHNFGEVYRMKISRNHKKYWFDGAWKSFTYKMVHLKIKLGGIVLPVKKKIPVSVQGPVFKTKHGWFALRYPSAMDIRQAEEWFLMNKAQNFSDFEKVLKMEALPVFNTTYADDAGNIFFISDGKMPWRDSTLNWNRPVDGTSSKYVWNTLVPYERKIKYLNPACGFLFNCNGTPLQATAYAENSTDYYVGLQLFTYNRNERFSRLLNEHKGIFSWADFKRIKYDMQYDTAGRYMHNFKALFTLDSHKYPELADAITKIKAWNLGGAATDKNAGIAMLTNKFLAKGLHFPYAILMIKEKQVTEEQAAKALKQAKQYLLKKYHTIDVELGQIQRLSRGEKNYAISGLSEVPRAVDTKYDKDKGFYKATAGDGYFQMLKFGKDGTQIQSISPFGSSTHPSGKHYTDQMELFVNEQTKTMSLKKEDVLKSAERIYHPGE